MNSIDKVNKLSKSDFISIFGNVFEKTEWIAQKSYDLKPYKNFEELFLKMMETFENTNKENHLKILNAHPDLAVEKKLTKDSKNEQKNASLNQCTDEEFIEFKKLNSTTLNNDGRADIPLVEGANFKEGKYELVFFVGDYFKKITEVPKIPFLDDVIVKFGISNAK